MFSFFKTHVVFASLLAASFAAEASAAHVAGGPIQPDSNPLSSLTLDCPADLTVGISANNCAATVMLPSPQASGQGCPGNITVTATSLLGTGFGPFWNVAPGKYPIVIKAINPCGDEAECTFLLTVKDTKKPLPVIVQSLFANLTGDGKVELEAIVYNQNSSDNCTAKNDLRFSFSENPLDIVRFYDCDSLGDRPVRIFVTDLAGNQASKLAMLHVWDAIGSCQKAAISGKISTETGLPVEGVTLSLAGNSDNPNKITGENGHFKIDKLWVGDTLAIRPTKLQNPLNGVTSFDLSLLMQHILGNKKLNSPWKIIAADINRNGLITTADLVQLRRLILGEISEFPDNESWRFVEKSTVFDNPGNPFQTNFLEEKWFKPVKIEVENLDFMAIKIGDLNLDAIPNNVSGQPVDDRSQTDFLLKTADLEFAAGDLVEVEIRADLTGLASFQATLEFDVNSLIFNELECIEPTGFIASNFGMSRLATGKLPFVWLADGTDFSAGEQTLFTIKFKAAASGKLSQLLRLGLSPTPADAFNKEGQTYFVKLDFEAGATATLPPGSSPRLELSNAPNPFSGETKISFEQPADGPVCLRIFDETGREIWRLDSNFTAGEQQILWNAAADLSGKTGLFFLRMDGPGGSQTRKIQAF